MKNKKFTFIEGLIAIAIVFLLFALIFAPKPKKKESVPIEKVNVAATSSGEIKTITGYVYEYSKVTIDGKEWILVVYSGDHSAFKLIPASSQSNLPENPFEKKGK